MSTSNRPPSSEKPVSEFGPASETANNAGARHRKPPASVKMFGLGFRGWPFRHRPPGTAANRAPGHTRGLRLARWNSAGLCCRRRCAIWWLSIQISRLWPSGDTDEKSHYSPPMDAMPEQSENERANNETAKQQRPADPEGTAVVYPEEVGGLMRPDGTIRTDLSLGELAKILRINPQRIASKCSPTEIDPEAFLFTTITGKLSESAKAAWRESRKIVTPVGMQAPVVGCEWVKAEVHFTLNLLKRPSREHKRILAAISRSRRGEKLRPGVGIRAVPHLSVPQGGRPKSFEFAGGHLPPEALPGERTATEADSDL